MNGRKRCRLFAVLAALLLSAGLLFSSPLTAQAAGRSAVVDLTYNGQVIASVTISEQEVINVTVPGYPTIQVQWTDPSVIRVLVPGQEVIELQVPDGRLSNGWDDDWGQMPQGETLKPSHEDITNSPNNHQQIWESSLYDSPDYDFVKLMGSDLTQEQYNMFGYYLNAAIAADPNLVQTFVDNGWRIILTTTSLDTLVFGGTTEGVEGATYFPQKTVYVHAGEYSYCVVHELGHFLDYVNGFASYTSGFGGIYYAEAANLTEYGKTSPTEFFAEVYSYLVLDPNTVYTYCPYAAEFVNSCRY